MFNIVIMLIECLVGFCVFTNCCVFGGFVFWMRKYSYVIDQLTNKRQICLMFSIANIIDDVPSDVTAAPRHHVSARRCAHASCFA